MPVLMVVTAVMAVAAAMFKADLGFQDPKLRLELKIGGLWTRASQNFNLLLSG